MRDEQGRWSWGCWLFTVAVLVACLLCGQLFAGILQEIPLP